MRRSFVRTPIVWALAALIFAAGTLAAQTPPDKFLGFKVGEDRKLADYAQIKAYFEKLAQESNRLKLFTIGESVLKKPMIMAAISTPENLAKLDRWKEITHKLRDPRTTSVEEARKLAREGKAIVLITCSLHSTEIAASQMSMELAYDLVTGKTFYRRRQGPQRRHLPARPDPQPGRQPDGRRLVQEIRRHASTRAATCRGSTTSTPATTTTATGTCSTCPRPGP